MDQMSRKERRKLLREQKKSETETKRGLLNLKKLFITLFGVFVLGFFGFRFYSWATEPVPEVAGAPVEAQDGDWIKGKNEAKVTLIEYSDFQCPACKTYVPLIKRLLEEYDNDLRVIYRHFPLPQHKNALPAAKAAEAAGKQGKFWEMHDILFDKQEEWSNEGDIVARLEMYAENIGVNKDQFRTDYESQEIANAVTADVALANTIRISSTPTFILNGQKITIRGYEDIKSKIDSALNSSN